MNRPYWAFICGPYQLHVFEAMRRSRGIDVGDVQLVCFAEGGDHSLTSKVVDYAQGTFGYTKAINLMAVFPSDFREKPPSRTLLKRIMCEALGGPGKDGVMEFCHSLGSLDVEAAVVRHISPHSVTMFEDGFSSCMKVNNLSPYLNLRKIGGKLLHMNFIGLSEVLRWAFHWAPNLTATSYWALNEALWSRYSRSGWVRERTCLIPREAMIESLKQAKVEPTIPFRAIIVGNVYAERGLCSFAHEIAVCERVIMALHDSGIVTAIKPHPRSSPEKVAALKELVDRFSGLIIEDTLRPLETYVVANPGNRPIVIGAPSTALLNTVDFNLGTALCTGSGVFTSTTAYTDKLFETAGVLVAHTPVQLDQFLREIR